MDNMATVANRNRQVGFRSAKMCLQARWNLMCAQLTSATLWIAAQTYRPEVVRQPPTRGFIPKWCSWVRDRSDGPPCAWGEDSLPTVVRGRQPPHRHKCVSASVALHAVVRVSFLCPHSNVLDRVRTERHTEILVATPLAWAEMVLRPGLPPMGGSSGTAYFQNVLWKLTAWPLNGSDWVDVYPPL